MDASDISTTNLGGVIAPEVTNKTADAGNASDYDNLESDDEPVYETISLLDHDVETPRINKRPLSVNFHPNHGVAVRIPGTKRPFTGDYTPVRTDDVTYSNSATTSGATALSGATTTPDATDTTVTDATTSRDDVTASALEPHAVVVQVTGGENEDDRSWTRLSEKSKRNSRASDVTGSMSPNAAVRALGGERKRNPSGRSHQLLEPPFRYKQWLMHLGRRRRCEILILLGLLLWLAFFFVLAVVLNGSKGKPASDSPNEGQKVTPEEGTTFGPFADDLHPSQSLPTTASNRIVPPSEKGTRLKPNKGHGASSDRNQSTVSNTAKGSFKQTTKTVAVEGEFFPDVTTAQARGLSTESPNHRSVITTSESRAEKQHASTVPLFESLSSQSRNIPDEDKTSLPTPPMPHQAAPSSGVIEPELQSVGETITSIKSPKKATNADHASSPTPQPPHQGAPSSGVKKPGMKSIEDAESSTIEPRVLQETEIIPTNSHGVTDTSTSIPSSLAPNKHTTTVYQSTNGRNPKILTAERPQDNQAASATNRSISHVAHTARKPGSASNTRGKIPTTESVVVPDLKPVGSEPSYATSLKKDIGEIVYPTSNGPVNISEILQQKPNYRIGVGRSDITGPAADVNMMGYANPAQTSGGIHIRQYARAFIIEDADPKTRVAFVNIDACMSSTLLKLEVLKALKSEFGDVYTAENLCISGTHTHSAPAGFLQDVLFQISSWGYVDETLTALVNGIVESIRIAHSAIRPGYILLNKGELLHSNINRSPLAYLNNPPEERALHRYDVDKEMTLLKFVDEKGDGIGMINWFPVHCTSMNNTNSLISGDNKGYAELLFERYMDPSSHPGESKFVAAFAQSHEGDVSPNTAGPHCLDTGEPCDNIHSTCNGVVQNCVASGPGKDMFESTKIIGENQYKKAKELYESAAILVHGPVDVVQQYVDMTAVEVTINDTAKVKTCKPAMGFSFAAGTTDGPGAFNFKQGDKSGNAFWEVVRNFLHSPSDEQLDCHFPKPILLDTGEMTNPYDWQPNIVDTQLMQIGQFAIIAVPGEFTTMAGRRLRNDVLETFFKVEPSTRKEAVIAGLSNTYSDYIATFEEYQVQRYEGASTIYGPYTSLAYQQQYKKLVKFLTTGQKPVNVVRPPNNKGELYSLLPGVIYDRSGFFSDFGDVLDEVKPSYKQGEEVVVKFIGANPRNVLQTSQPNATFLTVERQTPDGLWEIIHTDASWETKFVWKRLSQIKGTSEVAIVWQTDGSTKPGLYRIVHQGFYKYYLGGLYPYKGYSSDFRIEHTA